MKMERENQAPFDFGVIGLCYGLFSKGRTAPKKCPTVVSLAGFFSRRVDRRLHYFSSGTGGGGAGWRTLLLLALLVVM